MSHHEHRHGNQTKTLPPPVFNYVQLGGDNNVYEIMNTDVNEAAQHRQQDFV